MEKSCDKWQSSHCAANVNCTCNHQCNDWNLSSLDPLLAPMSAEHDTLTHNGLCCFSQDKNFFKTWMPQWQQHWLLLVPIQMANCFNTTTLSQPLWQTNLCMWNLTLQHESQPAHLKQCHTEFACFEDTLVEMTKVSQWENQKSKQKIDKHLKLQQFQQWCCHFMWCDMSSPKTCDWLKMLTAMLSQLPWMEAWHQPSWGVQLLLL